MLKTPLGNHYYHRCDVFWPHRPRKNDKLSLLSYCTRRVTAPTLSVYAYGTKIPKRNGEPTAAPFGTRKFCISDSHVEYNSTMLTRPGKHAAFICCVSKSDWIHFLTFGYWYENFYTFFNRNALHHTTLAFKHIIRNVNFTVIESKNDM